MTVRDATADDGPAVVEICVGGCADDPVMMWVVPDRDARLAGMGVAVTGLARSFLDEHSALQIVDDGCVTMWRAPTWQPAPAPATPRESPFAADVQERFRILGEGVLAAMPKEPHWYLNVISTHPSHQGRGLGARALAAMLERIDAAHEAAYLESSNPRNMTLYRRHGFEEIGTPIELPDGPSLVPMWRAPR